MYIVNGMSQFFISFGEMCFRRRLKQVSSLSFSEKCLLWMCETLLVWQPLINHLKKRGIHVNLILAKILLSRPESDLYLLNYLTLTTFVFMVGILLGV